MTAKRMIYGRRGSMENRKQHPQFGFMYRAAGMVAFSTGILVLFLGLTSILMFSHGIGFVPGVILLLVLVAVVSIHALSVNSELKSYRELKFVRRSYFTRFMCWRVLWLIAAIFAAYLATAVRLPGMPEVDSIFAYLLFIPLVIYFLILMAGFLRIMFGLAPYQPDARVLDCEAFDTDEFVERMLDEYSAAAPKKEILALAASEYVTKEAAYLRMLGIKFKKKELEAESEDVAEEAYERYRLKFAGFTQLRHLVAVLVLALALSWLIDAALIDGLNANIFPHLLLAFFSVCMMVGVWAGFGDTRAIDGKSCDAYLILPVALFVALDKFYLYHVISNAGSMLDLVPGFSILLRVSQVMISVLAALFVFVIVLSFMVLRFGMKREFVAMRRRAKKEVQVSLGEMSKYKDEMKRYKQKFSTSSVTAKSDIALSPAMLQENAGPAVGKAAQAVLKYYNAKLIIACYIDFAALAFAVILYFLARLHPAVAARSDLWEGLLYFITYPICILSPFLLCYGARRNRGVPFGLFQYLVLSGVSAIILYAQFSSFVFRPVAESVALYGLTAADILIYVALLILVLLRLVSFAITISLITKLERSEWS